MRIDEELFKKAFARVALAQSTSPMQVIIEATIDDRKKIDALAGPAMGAVQKAWESATKEASDFVSLVILNNPRKTLAQILVRPDVQEALHIPFEEAGDKTKSIVRDVWSKSATLGVNAAMRDLGELGFGDFARRTFTNTSTLNRLLKDVDANVSRATLQLLDLYEGDKAKVSAVDALGRTLGWRSSLTSDVASGHAFNEAKAWTLETFAKDRGVALKKVWVTRFGPGTCDTCASLHGYEAGFNEAFPESLSWGNAPSVYGKSLNHPPRHPHCRCVVIPFLEELKGGPTPATMKAFATSWFKKAV